MTSNTTVLITGTSTGFGREIANTLTRTGYRVFASMRDPHGKNLDPATELAENGANVIELDVTNSESVENAMKAVVTDAGRLDVLVNNAGVAYTGVSEAFTAEQARELFDVNVFGLHRVTRAALPILRRQQDGLIINIGSVVGRVTFPFFGLYGASKFAVEALTDSYRYELSQLGIDVALVQPGAHPTQLWGSAVQPADIARVAEYGEVGEIPDAMFGQFEDMFAGKDAPDPQNVASTIATIIATPKGERPTRTIVGNPLGSDIINEAAASAQTQLIDTLGLNHLASVRSDQRGTVPIT